MPYIQIYTNYINKRKPNGIYFTDAIQDIRLFLLGIIKDIDNGEKHICYAPEKFSSCTTFDNERGGTFGAFTTLLYKVYRIAGWQLDDDGPVTAKFQQHDEIRNRMEHALEAVLRLRDDYEHDRTKPDHTLRSLEEDYDVWKIPKRTPGKFREITSPHEKLKTLQRAILDLLDHAFGQQEHEAAHAYIHNRGRQTNAGRHQYANHIVKFDIHDFFPSITKDFTTNMLRSLHDFAILNMPQSPEQIYNAEYGHTSNCISKLQDYYTFCTKILTLITDYAFYNNGLPQGSPLSPKLSNLIMFPIDHMLTRINNDHAISKSMLMYTRYADDLYFSSYSAIDMQALQERIEIVLEHFDAPFNLNPEKTEYLQPSRKCYMTGVKINREHNLTYGHERKAELKRELFQILMAAKERRFDVAHNRVVLGRFADMQLIEPEYAKMVLRNYATKFHIPVPQIYKYLLNGDIPEQNTHELVNNPQNAQEALFENLDRITRIMNHATMTRTYGAAPDVVFRTTATGTAAPTYRHFDGNAWVEQGNRLDATQLDHNGNIIINPLPQRGAEPTTVEELINTPPMTADELAAYERVLRYRNH